RRVDLPERTVASCTSSLSRAIQAAVAAESDPSGWEIASNPIKAVQYAVYRCSDCRLRGQGGNASQHANDSKQP
ncbi:hypothetical protein, partial [Methyloglobulus sp.]|uniref:hypothetical protein n=1 Tax=Methyloglobulus sp. TaxID=2518622 RepID=UPI0032B7FE65